MNDGSFPPWYVSCFLQDHRGSSHPRPTCNVTSKKPQPSEICRETIFTKCCNRFKSSRRRKLTILVERIFIENHFSIFFNNATCNNVTYPALNIIQALYQMESRKIFTLFILYRDFYFFPHLSYSFPFLNVKFLDNYITHDRFLEIFQLFLRCKM